MEEPQPTDQKPQDDSLANLLPEPIREDDGPYIGMLQGGLIVCAVLGGTLMLVEGTTTSTLGAARSTKLRWEQRQTEIDQAQQNARVEYRQDK
jgi:hypothetical protein